MRIKLLPSIDPSPAPGPIELVPLRLAKIAWVSTPGSTVAISFVLGKVVLSTNLTAFNQDAANQTGNVLPQWSGAPGFAQGKFCARLSNKPTSYVEVSDLSRWEKVVDQVSARRDFRKVESFFTVIGILTTAELDKVAGGVQHEEWPSDVPPDSSLDLVFYHYHTDGNRFPDDLTVELSSSSDFSLESHKSQKIDSPYDLKRFRLRSGTPLRKRANWLSLSTAGASAQPSLRIDMETSVNGDWKSRALIAGTIGLALSGAQISPLLIRDDLGKTASAIAIVLVIFGFNLLVGAAAAFGIKRSP